MEDKPEIHIWPTGHISGQSVFDIDVFIYYSMTPSDVTSDRQ